MKLNSKINVYHVFMKTASQIFTVPVPTGAVSDSSHTSTHINKTTTSTIIKSRQLGFNTIIYHAIQSVKVVITSNITCKLRKFCLSHVFINDAIAKIGSTCQSSACRKNHQFQVNFAPVSSNRAWTFLICYHSTFWSQFDVGKRSGLNSVQLFTANYATSGFGAHGHCEVFTCGGGQISATVL